MKIEELKQGQAVWVKGFVDRSIFGERYGFINFYKKDGNNLGHISKNNVREMKEEDVQIGMKALIEMKIVLGKFSLLYMLRMNRRMIHRGFQKMFKYGLAIGTTLLPLATCTNLATQSNKRNCTR